jgi:hypothetical protein
MSKYVSPYSLIKKGTKEYREALRSVRRNYKRYGAKFDNTELYNLDSTIYKYVRNHKLIDHPYLEQCGLGDQGRYNKYWEKQGITLDQFNKDYTTYWEKEDEFYKEVNFAISKLTDKKFFEFLLPRLKAFKNKSKRISNRYIVMKTIKKYLQSVIDEIETKGTCTLIYEKFNTLWI